MNCNFFYLALKKAAFLGSAIALTCGLSSVAGADYFNRNLLHYSNFRAVMLEM